MATAYCMKCRKKVEIKNAQQITLKNGRPATQGVCSVCGTKVFRIGKSQGEITYTAMGKSKKFLIVGSTNIGGNPYALKSVQYSAIIPYKRLLMGCPICDGKKIPDDASLIEKHGKRVAVQGRVYAIILPGYTYSPFRNYATVSLYPRKGKVKYLKFETQQELDRWRFEENKTFIVHGCLHIVNGKELVFNITQVERPVKPGRQKL